MQLKTRMLFGVRQMGIFKDFQKEYEKVQREFSLNENEFMQQKKELLSEIVDYINSYKWLSGRKLKEKVKCYLSCGYDYDFLCKSFNISYGSARSSMKWASKQLRKRIGEHTLELIKNDNIDEARLAFYVGTNVIKKEDFILNDLISELPEPQFTASLNFSDCRNELIILCNLSRARLNYYIDVMDKRKMAYLLHLMEGSSVRANTKRPLLLNYLIGGLSLNELIEEEKNCNEIYI